MPLHDYIIQIYKNVEDKKYFVRFLDFIITKQKKRVEFFIQPHPGFVKALVTGILADEKIGKYYWSLAEYYNAITGNNIAEDDVSIFKKISITRQYTLHRMLCNIKESDILEFVDFKYRAYLFYDYLFRRINLKVGHIENEVIDIECDGEYFKADKLGIYHEDLSKIHELLDKYDDRTINYLYYCVNNDKYLISE